MLEGHVLRQTTPRRLRSGKKRSPSRVVRRSLSSSSDESHSATPVKTATNSTPVRTHRKPAAQRHRSTVRRVSVSTMSSDTSRTVTPRKPPARHCLSMSKAKQETNVRQTRQSVKRLLCDIDSGSGNESAQMPVKRVLRSSTYH